MSHLVYQHYPFEEASLAKNWRVASIGEVVLEVQPGFASGEHNKQGIGIPHIRPMNIDRNGRLDLTVLKHVAPGAHALRLNSGDVLFNNTNSPELIGKTAPISTGIDCGFSNHMTRLKLATGVNYKFVAYQLHLLWMAGYFLHRCVHHVNQASLSSSALTQTVPLRLAPTATQDRIVAKIDELFSELDAGTAALERVRAGLNRYRAAVLKAAVEGKLTEDWRAQHPDTEPASALLDRILTERRRKWEEAQLAKFVETGKQPPKGWQTSYPTPQTAPHKAPFALPQKWAWATADQLTDETKSITYGVIKLGEREKDGIPTLRSSNVRHLRLDLKGVKTISPEVASRYQRTFLEGGEILITVRGTLGGVVSVPLSCRGFNISREVAMLALVDPSLSSTLALFIGSPPIQSLLKNSARGIAYTGINISDLKELPLPLTPQAEHSAIQSETERRLSIADEIDAQVEYNMTRTARLRQSILKRAFEGHLVPQDPTDEPAEQLLARIRQQREADAQAKGGRATARPRKASRKGGKAAPLSPEDGESQGGQA